MNHKKAKRELGKFSSRQKISTDPLACRGVSYPYGAGGNFAHTKLAPSPRSFFLYLKLTALGVCLGALALLSIHSITNGAITGNAQKNVPQAINIWVK
jgi:hypothetical protein